MCKKKNIKITYIALKQIKKLIKIKKKNLGISIQIKKSGCAGYKYFLKFIKKKKKKKKNYIFKKKNIKIFIKKKQYPLIKGIKIDFIKNNLNKSFIFKNKIKKQICGCGESFNILK